ncbi:hypothetical protein [Marichromatium sp. AB31]|uniref:hypothetical protein n=1 Tax=Marichromatium sp. AB31 TaxID=2483362 RepID=UPI000F3B0711|nr:hypothetical protein [Marichromatium sp. AB31]RNE89847.1 hypothetical protein EBL84_09165 [Marichromatium sp. AB31]
MAIDDLRRMIAGQGFEDDVEACLDRAGCSEGADEFARSSWPIPGIRDELVSATDGLIQIHRAIGVAPSEALRAALEEHVAALRGLTDELIDRVQAPGEGVRDAA